jgi:hypothetical protein
MRNKLKRCIINEGCEEIVLAVVVMQYRVYLRLQDCLKGAVMIKFILFEKMIR